MRNIPGFAVGHADGDPARDTVPLALGNKNMRAANFHLYLRGCEVGPASCAKHGPTGTSDVCNTPRHLGRRTISSRLRHFEEGLDRNYYLSHRPRFTNSHG